MLNEEFQATPEIECENYTWASYLYLQRKKQKANLMIMHHG